MIKFQMSKLFDELDNNFKDFTIEEQTKFASKVNEYLQSLPEEQQKIIKEKLGVNDLTNDMIRKVIITSGSSILFAIIVEVSGFAFYMTANSLLASIATGIFGVTLSFTAYSTLTSTIAILANPLFFVPVLLGGGALLAKHQNKKLKKKLLPITIMQITLPYMSKEADEVSFDLFITEWKRRFKQYCRLHEEIKFENDKERKIQNKIKITKEQLNNINSSIFKEELQIRKEKLRIYNSLKSINLYDLEINETFRKNRREYFAIQNKIQTLQRSKKIDAVNDSFFRKIGNKLSNLVTNLDIKSEEQKMDKYLYLMVEDVLNSDCSFKQTERERIKISTTKLRELRQYKHEKMLYKNSLESLLKQVHYNQSKIRTEIELLKKQNYGFNHLSVNATQQLLLINKEEN